jgi:hypothetical protein
MRGGDARLHGDIAPANEQNRPVLRCPSCGRAAALESGESLTENSKRSLKADDRRDAWL